MPLPWMGSRQSMATPSTVSWWRRHRLRPLRFSLRTRPSPVTRDRSGCVERGSVGRRHRCRPDESGATRFGAGRARWPASRSSAVRATEKAPKGPGAFAVRTETLVAPGHPLGALAGRQLRQLPLASGTVPADLPRGTGLWYGAVAICSDEWTLADQVTHQEFCDRESHWHRMFHSTTIGGPYLDSPSSCGVSSF